MREEHLKAVFDSFVSLVKPFTRDLDGITLSLASTAMDDSYSGVFDNGRERIEFSKEIKKDVYEWKGGDC